MATDIDTTTEAMLVQEPNGEHVPTASRRQRLLAAMLDGLIIALITGPTMYFTGGFTGIAQGVQPSIGYNLFIGLIGICAFFLFNGKLLVQNGQTIGKKVIGIRIVDLEGNIPTIKKHLLARYATYLIPGLVPIVGQFFSTINILFIFGKQKRCVHDYIAGTMVVAG